MPRSKKKKAATRGKERGHFSPGKIKPTNTLTISDQESQTRAGFGKDLLSSFSLQSEALNTQRHQLSFSSDQKLRHARVNFISVGSGPPFEPMDTETATAEMSLVKPLVKMGEVITDENMDFPSADPTLETNLQQYVVDTTGDFTLNTGIPQLSIRSVSPTLSTSSDEVMLFTGRTSRVDQTSPQSNVLTQLPQALPRVLGDHTTGQGRILIDITSPGSHKGQVEAKDIFDRPSSVPAAESQAFSKPRWQNLFSSKKSHRSQRTFTDNMQGSRFEPGLRHEDPVIADYISNLAQQDVEVSKSFITRELGGEDGDIWQDSEVSTENVLPTPNIDGWDTPALDDIKDLSTSEEPGGSTIAILQKRYRLSGCQYLVVSKEHGLSGAKWITAVQLDKSGASALIDSFERQSEAISHNPEGLNADEQDSSAVDFDDDTDDSNSGEDILANSMTDEKVAQLLAKQEELGMGSDKLVLFDDSANGGDLDEKLTFYPVSKHKKRAKRRQNVSRNEFPAACALADAFDDFDIMDFERPSIRPKRKGRSGDLAIDLVDSELEDGLQAAWEKDRLRKKERKIEREELRSRGILGKKDNPNLKTKYKEGMGISEVKDEIKNFLISGDSTLALPPMDKANRKVVHELVNAFNLKSKSIGSGQKRFPILYRTSRTSAYVESSFAAVEARISRRFLPRMDLKGRRGQLPDRSGKGGFNKAAVSYRDGDIVGGSAPELGLENKGRVMLEKMGWSNGTALGAINNKGILQPVTHIVKTTKAGLG